MTVFEAKDRDYLGPRTYTECEANYLDRSARPGCGAIRQFINDWAAKLPEQERVEMARRLHDQDDRKFNATFFELVLFACMRTLGYEVQVHPLLPNGSLKRPDFLVTTSSGAQFYLEAVVASEYDAEQLASEKRKAVVLDIINGLDSPNFVLMASADGDPLTPPPARKLQGALLQWLLPLDPDEVERVVTAGVGDRPTFIWNHDGWRIEFTAIPKRAEARGGMQRTIGTYLPGCRWVGSWQPMRDAVRDKGTRYGSLDLPYIVAVNIDSISVDRRDERQALFGGEMLALSVDDPDAEPVFHRERNGAWRGPTGPQLTRVSGVWFFDSLTCWNLHRASPTLYRNPWGKLAFPQDLEVLTHASVEIDHLTWHPGLVPAEILGLTSDWLE